MFSKLILINLLLATGATILVAQNRVRVEGTVLDAETRKPISAANVTVVGQTTGTSTDSLGQFGIDLPQGSHVITFTHVGYNKMMRGFVADRQSSVTWKIEMTPMPVELDGLTVTAKRPFSEQLAKHTIKAVEFERLAEPDMEQALRYLLPSIVRPWDVRMKYPSMDITLYLNGKWKNSIYLFDIDPKSVRRVLVWEAAWSPVGLPVHDGEYVVSIETK